MKLKKKLLRLYNKLGARQKVEAGISFVVLVSLIFTLYSNYGNLLFKADTITPGILSNLTNNGNQYAGSTQNAPIIPQYEQFELTFDIKTPATNYFWPYDTSAPSSIPSGTGITIEGLFNNGIDGKIYKVPGFYYQDFENHQIKNSPAVDGSGNIIKSDIYNMEAENPKGLGHWKIRFSPTTISANWTYQISVTDADNPNGATVSRSSFASSKANSNNHGFAGVSPTDTRYFELSDGTPLLGPGITAHDEIHSVLEAATKLKSYGDNGVKIVRWFMTGQEYQNPFGISGWDATPQWRDAKSTTNSHDIALANGQTKKDRYSGILSSSNGEAKQSVYLLANKHYCLTGYTNGGKIKLYAIRLDSNGGFINPNFNQLVDNTGKTGWQPFSFDINTGAGDEGAYMIRLELQGGSPTMYYDDLSLKEYDASNNSISGEYLSKPDFDFQNYIDLKEAWKVDQIFQYAKDNGIYLKPIISTYYDSSLGEINSDGSTGGFDVNNFYSWDNLPSRWLQQAWWRYMVARWGSYTSLHSFELVNEGDPNSSTHANAANALANEVHSSSSRRIMTTTSFWHSIPMEMWKNNNSDYMDVHEYIGPATKQTFSHGARYYAWQEPIMPGSIDESSIKANNLKIPPFSTGGCTLNFDNNTSGVPPELEKKSLKIVSDLSGGSGGRCIDGFQDYHAGINPDHYYTLSFWAKTQNYIPSGANITSMAIYWSLLQRQNDNFSDQTIRQLVDSTSTTSGWKQYTLHNIKPPSQANTANILAEAAIGGSTLWLDNLEFRDQGTKQFNTDNSNNQQILDNFNYKYNLYIDGGFEGDRIDYDLPLAIQKYGTVFRSYASRMTEKNDQGQITRVGAPVIWGESGVRRGDDVMNPEDENLDIINDEKNGDGIGIKKAIWAHTGPDNPNMLLWYVKNISATNWRYFGTFQNFMSGIPVSNGKYTDIQPNTTIIGDSRIRTFGQQEIDLVTKLSQRAHMWIDNSNYTWYNKVNNKVIAGNPSGTIKVAGFKDGNYTIEQWDTSTGNILSSTRNIQPENGNIQFDVNFTSDIAVKIYSDSIPPSETRPSTSINASTVCPSGICANQKTTFQFTATPYNNSVEAVEQIQNIYYKLNNASYATCANDAKSCSIEFNLNSGSNTISYYSTDKDGHSSSIGSATVNYNPPSKDLTALQNVTGGCTDSGNDTFSCTSNPTIHLSNSSNPAVKSINYSIGNTSFDQTISTDFTLTLDPANDVQLNYRAIYSDDTKEATQTKTYKKVEIPPPPPSSGTLSITSNPITYLTNPKITGTKESNMDRIVITKSDDSDGEEAATNNENNTWSITLNKIVMSNILGINNSDGKNSIKIWGISTGNGFKTILSDITRRKAGDGNGDGKVDSFDFSGLMHAWGKKTGETDFNYLFDFNGNNEIWQEDYAGMMANWGK